MTVQDSGSRACDAYRFDSFEVRVRARILDYEGQPLDIQELPFQMLLALLERPGEMVTKEELRDRLWGQTFVEVDKSLYVVAAKLREALGDDVTRPRFIKTISGRGYRFIGKVTPVVQSTAELPAEPAPPAAPTATKEPGTRRRSWQIVAGSLLAIIASAAIGFYTYKFLHRPLANERDRVVVGGFSNNSGNPDLDKTLSFAIQLKLQESPYLSLIPDQNFRRLVNDPDSAPLQDELHACASLGGQLLLSGQILSQGQSYRILLSARRCADGRLLNTQTAEADSPATILSAVDRVTEQMRRRLGESENSLRKFNAPLTQSTTASLAALRVFTMGEENRSLGRYSESIANYKLAIDLDPQFALAYEHLGGSYTNTRQPSLSRQYYRKAFDLRDRTTDRERLSIISHYYAIATGEILRAIEDYEQWRTMYPRDFVPTNNLAVEYLEIGQPKKTVEFARRAIQLNPTSQLPYGTLAEAYAKTGDYANVNLLCHDPAHAEDDFFGLHDACFAAAFAQHDESGMQRQLQWARGKPYESILLSDTAWIAMYRGRVSEGRRLISQAKQNALQNNLPELAADLQLDSANVEADFGLAREAREDALSALGLAPEHATEQALAALALARVGDVPRSEVESRKASSQAPLDTLLNSAMLASVRAAIDLQKHDSKGAVQSLEETRPFDFCASIGPAPAYYRGLAYMQDNQPQQAINEFQQLLDRRLLASYPLYDPLTQLRLGRAYQMIGDRAHAAQAYSEAEKVWKDADPGFPPLQELHDYQRELDSTLRTQARR
jgi:DNA-binding winged helix-turn-helix (wHTH) protein/tetratricopeptide (TPR) repeat protein